MLYELTNVRAIAFVLGLSLAMQLDIPLKRIVAEITVQTKLSWYTTNECGKTIPTSNQGTGILIDERSGIQGKYILTAAHCLFEGLADRYDKSYQLSKPVGITFVKDERKFTTLAPKVIEDRDFALVSLGQQEDWTDSKIKIVLVETPPEQHVLFSVFGLPIQVDKEGYSLQNRLTGIEGQKIDDMEPCDPDFYFDTPPKDYEHRDIEGMSGGGVFVSHYISPKSKETIPITAFSPDTLFLVGILTETKAGKKDLKCESVCSLKNRPELEGIDHWTKEDLISFLKDKELVKEVAAVLGRACVKSRGNTPLFIRKFENGIRVLLEDEEIDTWAYIRQFRKAMGNAISINFEQKLSSEDIALGEKIVLDRLDELSNEYQDCPNIEVFMKKVYQIIES